MNEIGYTTTIKGQLIFSFYSEGPNGRIEKLIKYEQISNRIYNLGFGDRIGNSLEFRDDVISNNQDARKIIITVISTIPDFFSYYPIFYW